jgi:hypothetical protein
MFGCRRTILAATVAWIVCLLTYVSAAGQAGLQPAPQMSENVFKNIQVLRGIPADEFMDTMGMFASSLLFDCTGCHVRDILINREAFAMTTPRIQRARQMVLMVNAINKTYFAGEPRISCFTCHKGNSLPEVIPDLGLQYGEPHENPNAMSIVPEPRMSAGQIFGKYLQAIGGVERLSKLTSFVATGTYAGFNTSNDKVPIEIYARAPDQRTQIVKTFEGEAIQTTDGRDAWAAEGWRQLPLLTFTGENVANARLEAMLWFPAGIQKAFSQWQATGTVIDDRDVDVVQASNPGQLPVNFYFDESGLLIRLVRWRKTTVGTIPTEIDFSDYREVNGVKVPFKQLVRWTNGQNSIEFADVRANVPIDAGRFARPAPFRPR